MSQYSMYLLKTTGDGRRPVPVAGKQLPPGTLIRTDSLAQVVSLMGGGLAEPCDERTRLDGELGVLLRRALPRTTR